jgi:hypothetical protein
MQGAASCCTSLAGASPVSVSTGAPSSRPQASGEIPVARAGCRKPLRREQARGPQLNVKPAASTDLQSELGGVWGAARVQGEVRNTRDPSARPESGQAGSYKRNAKSSGGQRESEGIAVLSIAATNNAAGGKGPCGGHAGSADTHEGMTGKTGSNHPEGFTLLDQVRHPQRRLGVAAKRFREPSGVRTMRRPERPLGKPCAGNPHARFERGSCPHPADSSNWRQ